MANSSSVSDQYVLSSLEIGCNARSVDRATKAKLVKASDAKFRVLISLVMLPLEIARDLKTAGLPQESNDLPEAAMNSSFIKSALLLGSFAFAPAMADDASWMQDNEQRLRNLPLESLSVPASHDAGMYMHHLGLIEIGLEDLHAGVYADWSVSWLPDFEVEIDPPDGVIEGEPFLALFDDLMSAVDAFDEICIPIPIIDDPCFDTGLYDLVWGWVGEYYELATGKPGELSITQNLDIYGQLSNGVRMFDLRPKSQGGALFIHHSQARMEGIGDNVDYELRLEFTVPCIDRPYPFTGCITGTGRAYDIGTIVFEAGGFVRSLSVTGPSMPEILGDVADFMQEGHRELVVLEFTHYWKGFNGSEFDAADYVVFVDLIDQYLAPWLLTSDMVAEDALASSTMGELIGSQGRVIVLVETNDTYAVADPSIGLWPAGDSLFDSPGGYSNSDDLDTMRDDQRQNWLDASGDRFELWWTLTCQPGSIDCSVRDNADAANPHLQDFVGSLVVPNDWGNYINEIWVDFAEETAALDIALAMNPWPVELLINPGRPPQTINPAAVQSNVRVAILSDAVTNFDALQIDPTTVKLGRGGAAPLDDKAFDLNADGIADRFMIFNVNDAAIVCGDDSVSLTGKTFGKQNFIGTGNLKTTACNFSRFSSGGGGVGWLMLALLLMAVGSKYTTVKLRIDPVRPS